MKLALNTDYILYDQVNLPDDVQSYLVKASKNLPHGVLIPCKAARKDTPMRGIDSETFNILRSLDTNPALIQELDWPTLEVLFRYNITDLHTGDTILKKQSALLAIAKERLVHYSLPSLEQNIILQAASYPTLNQSVLQNFLYTYNRRPLTRALQTRFPSIKMLNTFFDLHPHNGHHHPKYKMWTYVTGEDEYFSNWHFWENKNYKGRGAKIYKLYVALPFEALARSLPRIFRILSQNNAQSAKLAKPLEGVLRCDYFISYFTCLKSLKKAANELKDYLGKQNSNPIPFTAKLSPNGSLSWGTDPISGVKTQESWRSSICGVLAEALVRSEADNDLMKRIEYAIKSLQAKGVDVQKWSLEKGTKIDDI